MRTRNHLCPSSKKWSKLTTCCWHFKPNEEGSDMFKKILNGQIRQRNTDSKKMPKYNVNYKRGRDVFKKIGYLQTITEYLEDTSHKANIETRQKKIEATQKETDTTQKEIEIIRKESEDRIVWLIKP